MELIVTFILGPVPAHGPELCCKDVWNPSSVDARVESLQYQLRVMQE
jgi:hypothetical protein